MIGYQSNLSMRLSDDPPNRAPAVSPRIDYSQIIASLAALDVPFAVFGRAGDCRFASSAAREALGDSTAGPAWSQIRSLVGNALAAPHTPHHRAIRRSPVTGLACEVVVHLLPWPSEAGAAIIILCPTRAERCEFDLAQCGLTPREQEVARLIAAGHSTKSLGAALSISCHTARRHTERVFAKLGVRGRVELTILLTRSTASEER